MNLPIVGNKKECWRKLLILCLFAGILYVIRIPYGLVSDDAVIAQTINSQTLLGNFMDRWQYNGRIFTDVLANLFYRMPMIVWKLFDIAIYILIALLISKIFTEDSWTDISIVCVLILMFPGSYLGSAGYIATTTNYVYPVAGLLGVMYHVSRVRHRQRVSWWQYLITGVCILYITNHDQSGMVLIGGLFLYLIYCIVLKENKAVIVNTGVWLLFSVACYIFMFTIPGHIYRMASTAEMERWFPQYADWSLLKKIYHGFSTTVANFLFSNVKLFSLIVLLLFVLALSQDVFYKKIIAAVPVLVLLLSNCVGTGKFIVFFDYSCKMPDLIPLSQSVLPFLIALISVCCIFYTAWSCMKNRQRKYLVFMLLILAAGSREMMGLSATLYASSFRTFTFFLYATIACCLLILQELKSEKKNYEWYSGLGAIAALAIQ